MPKATPVKAKPERRKYSKSKKKGKQNRRKLSQAVVSQKETPETDKDMQLREEDLSRNSLQVEDMGTDEDEYNYHKRG